MQKRNHQAFTLIELLVVISVAALIMGVLVPALAKARTATRAVVCRTNLHSLALANIGYACQNNEYMCLAASDINSENLQRWHGARTSKNDPFDPQFSPLVSYIDNGKIKKCPQKVKFRHGDPWEWDYEDGCGGYGYNKTYLGSRIWSNGYTASNQATRITEIRSPGDTLMFADTAMAKSDETGLPYFLEYSFAEAPFFLSDGKKQTAFKASPSLHFRHNKQVNIAWADGHVDSERILPYDEQNVYGVNSLSMMLGWFKVLDNDYFDLK